MTEPTEIITPQHLELLPLGSVIQETPHVDLDGTVALEEGDVLVREVKGWLFDNCCDRHKSSEEVTLPALLLYTPPDMPRPSGRWQDPGTDATWMVMDAIGCRLDGEDGQQCSRHRAEIDDSGRCSVATSVTLGLMNAGILRLRPTPSTSQIAAEMDRVDKFWKSTHDARAPLWDMAEGVRTYLERNSSAWHGSPGEVDTP